MSYIEVINKQFFQNFDTIQKGGNAFVYLADNVFWLLVFIEYTSQIFSYIKVFHFKRRIILLLRFTAAIATRKSIN